MSATALALFGLGMTVGYVVFADRDAVPRSDVRAQAPAVTPAAGEASPAPGAPKRKGG